MCTFNIFLYIFKNYITFHNLCLDPCVFVCAANAFVGKKIVRNFYFLTNTFNNVDAHNFYIILGAFSSNFFFGGTKAEKNLNQYNFSSFLFFGYTLPLQTFHLTHINVIFILFTFAVAFFCIDLFQPKKNELFLGGHLIILIFLFLFYFMAGASSKYVLDVCTHESIDINMYLWYNKKNIFLKNRAWLLYILIFCLAYCEWHNASGSF